MLPYVALMMAPLASDSANSSSSSSNAMPSAATSVTSLSASGSESDAAGASVETPAPATLSQNSKASDDLCMWTQQTSDICDLPRSCYDCLNASPGDDIQCVITSAGICTTMDAYVYTQDWRLNPSASAPHYFPSINTTYCEDDDATCEACAADEFIKSAGGNTEPSQYCVGDDGCVCVGFCESPIYSSLVASELCSTAGSDPESVMGISVTDMIVFVVLCFTVPVFIYLWAARRTRIQRLRREEACRNRPPVNGPILELAGWTKHRQEQMASEQQTIASLITSSDGGQPNAVEPSVPTTAASEDAPLSNLQIAALSVEFEDPEHPMTAVTSTGRRRSNINDWSASATSGEQQESKEEESSSDSRVTPYTELEDSAPPENQTRR